MNEPHSPVRIENGRVMVDRPRPAKPHWEHLTHDTFETTDRLKVPGGWLYRTQVRHCEYGVGVVGHSIQLCFVPEVQAQ